MNSFVVGSIKMRTAWQPICLLLSVANIVTGLQIPAIGDWGDDEASGIITQKEVAAQLNTWCGTNTCEFILDVGDNFYPEGVLSATDERFDSSWRNIYNLPNIAEKNWYISLGNRDYIDKKPSDGRELYQIQFGWTEPRWILPHLWYDFLYEDPAGFSVHFVVVDSQALRWSANNAAGQWAWIEQVLSTSTAEWKVLVSHHPPYACGNQGPTDDIIEGELLPIAKKHKVQLFLSGHDHNFQHIQNATNVNEIDYVISGGGGRKINDVELTKLSDLISRGLRVPYFGYHHGFVDLVFTADQLNVRYVKSDGTIPYQFTRRRSTEP